MVIRKSFLMAATAALASALPAVHAQSLSHAIDSVTVYPDRAMVSRLIEFESGPDSGELVIDGLPADLRGDSLRVTPLEPSGLALADVSTRTVRGNERNRDEARTLQSRIDALEAQGEEVDARLEALDLQLSFLQNAASTDGEQAPAWEQLGTITESIGRSAGGILEARLQARRERREINEELERLRQSLNDLGNEATDSIRVTIGYRQPDNGSGRMRLDYVVPGARWRADYDLRLSTEERVLGITQKASITQDTGEDWNNVEVTVSTSQPSMGDRLPDLVPWFVDIREQTTQHYRSEPAAPEVMLGDARGGSGADSAELLNSAFSAEYRLPGRVSIAADSQPRSFALSREETTVELAARAVPKRSSDAWLFVTGEYGGDAPLPTGSGSLYRDGVMVAANTRVSSFIPGTEFEMGFGLDQRITVSHELTRDTKGESGFFSRSNRRERAYVMEVTNGHEQAMPITILDQLPVARDERIEVSLLDDVDAPDRRDLGDRPGIVAWDLELEPGETRRIRFGYKLTFPEEAGGLEGW